MPEIDGFKVANSIRSIEKIWFGELKEPEDIRRFKCRQQCPIVAVTACTSSDIEGLA